MNASIRLNILLSVCFANFLTVLVSLHFMYCTIINTFFTSSQGILFPLNNVLILVMKLLSLYSPRYQIFFSVIKHVGFLILKILKYWEREFMPRVYKNMGSSVGSVPIWLLYTITSHFFCETWARFEGSVSLKSRLTRYTIWYRPV